MRGALALGLISLALAMIIALALAPGGGPEGSGEPEASDAPGRLSAGADEGISFTALSDGEAVETTMAEWLPGVVAGEMPASFEPEALKAQAVAARTYIIHLMGGAKAAHPEAAVCDDPGCCKAHLTEAEMRGRWGGSFEANYNKILDAVRSTDGEYLAYEGEAIEAVFHSSSAGMTEDSAELWSARPYLVSVSSPESGEDVPDYVTAVELTGAEFAEKILSARPGAELEGNEAFWLGEISRDASGRVESAVIGGESFTGQELRELFSLRSTAFSLSWTGGAFLFTVTGYGHGVGMSQYGANVMAQSGANYEEILTHYYQGAVLAAW